MNDYSQTPQYSPIYTPVEMPQELRKWNWGAFAFGIWWGIGHKTYLPLLALVPFLNFIWIFVCGAKGNEWAWKAGNYMDINHFNVVMAPWNRAGKISTIIMVIFFALYILVFAIIFLVIMLSSVQ